VPAQLQFCRCTWFGSAHSGSRTFTAVPFAPLPLRSRLLRVCYVAVALRLFILRLRCSTLFRYVTFRSWTLRFVTLRVCAVPFCAFACVPLPRTAVLHGCRLVYTRLHCVCCGWLLPPRACPHAFTVLYRTGYRCYATVALQLRIPHICILVWFTLHALILDSGLLQFAGYGYTLPQFCGCLVATTRSHTGLRRACSTALRLRCRTHYGSAADTVTTTPRAHALRVTGCRAVAGGWLPLPVARGSVQLVCPVYCTRFCCCAAPHARPGSLHGFGFTRILRFCTGYAPSHTLVTAQFACLHYRLRPAVVVATAVLD